MSIKSFRNSHAFLSNFYPAEIYLNGIFYKTAEHAYQANKVALSWQKAKIREAPSPGIAKRLGKQYKIRSDWPSIKDQIMYEIVQAKFYQNSALADKLLDTGDEILIEGNYWGDTYWGICNGQGENRLGKILMQVRNELRAWRAWRAKT